MLDLILYSFLFIGFTGSITTYAVWRDRQRMLYYEQLRKQKRDELLSQEDSEFLDNYTILEDAIVGETCTICMDEFDNDREWVRTILCKGRHKFHSDCFRIFIKHQYGNVKCPTCRELFIVS